MKKILLIEDEEIVYQVCRDFLAREYEVFWARDGVEGLNLFYSKVPDLVLLDLMLPGLDGLQLCRVIKSDPDYYRIPVIILTACDDRARRFWGENAGADDYVIKPFDLDDLKDSIRRLLDFQNQSGSSGYQTEHDIFLHIIKLLEKKLFQISIINQINQALLSEYELIEVLTQVAESIFRVCSVKSVALYYFEKPNLIRKAMLSASKQTEEFFPSEIRLENYGQRQALLRELNIFFAPGEKIYLHPLLKAENLLGIVCCQIDKSEDFNSKIEMLEALANCASLAIWKAGVYMELKQKADNLEDANQRLKKMQTEMVLKEKLVSMGQLAAALAHEINNPLASISGFSQILMDDIPRDKRREFCLKIITETERITTLTERLLHFSEVHPATDRINLIGVFEEAVNLLSGHPEFRNTRIKNLAAGECFIRMDRNDLLQIFINLMLNSIQAMKGEGSIYLNTGITPPLIWIEISDSGPGIMEEHYDKVFQPFFTTKGRNGTGLGLPICFMLAEKNGGKLFLSQKKSEYGGASFRLEFQKEVV
ncbi:MAG: response regulator [Candidatus Wallbacteria bacterium]|nr:response regulator [Candidatus Wallbacteria bacterium]